LPTVSDHDTAIRADKLSKLYHVVERAARYNTLRASVTNACMAPFRSGTVRRPAARRDPTMWALKDVSFDIARGDVVGIIGRNGAGKSTLLKVLSRITAPTTGSARIRGRVGSLLEVGTGFHNELTGRENIFLNGAILGMRNVEIKQRFDAIVAFAEVERFVDTPVKHYSTGMYLRLAFAVAAHLEPEILLVDEVLAVGDVAFQTKCLGKMDDVARQGRTVLFVSHNMGAVRSLCRTGIVLNNGSVATIGDVGPAIETYYRLMSALRMPEGVDGAGGTGFDAVVINDGSATVNSGDGFRASTSFAVPDTAAGYSLYCTLSDMHGRRVFTQVEARSDVRPGRHAVTFDCPELWLATGLYSLHFKALFQGSFGSARLESDHVPLDVIGGETRSDAILAPAARWRIDQGAAQACSRH
jgi:lipopolysaccharide transport system ATP-binding protein